MPKIEFNSEAFPQPPVDANVSLTSPTYKHSLVDTQNTPLSAVMTHIGGSTYECDYYSQVISKDEELSAYNPNQLAPYQQYHLIHNLELKLQGAFSSSPNDETQEMVVTGTARLYPYVRPNVGDAFIADIGSGRAGQFTVTGVTPLSIQKQTVYEIQFELARDVYSEEVVSKLNEKVVKESYFVKDFLLYGQNPILVEEDFLLLNNSNKTVSLMIDEYLAEFLSRQFSTLAAPYLNPTYDPYLVKAFLSIVNHEDHPRIRMIKEYNVDEVKDVYDFSIWTMLINYERNISRSIWKQASPISVNTTNINPQFQSIRYSGFFYFMKALMQTDNIDTYYGFGSRPTVGSLFGWNGGGIVPSALAQQNIPSDNTVHPELPGYVVSLDFWDEDKPAIDEYEGLIRSYLKGDAIDCARIIKLYDERRTWSRLDRFYRTLVLLIILKSSIRRM